MSESVVLALCDLGCGVLVVAAFAKLADPRSFAAAMSSAGAGPARRWRPVSRLVGAGELALGALVFIVGGSIGFVALALAFAGFAAIAAAIMRRGGTCGCFGVRSAPVGRVHVALNAMVVVAAGVAAGFDASPLIDRVGSGIAEGVAYLLWLAIGTAAVVATMTSASELALLVRDRKALR